MKLTHFSLFSGIGGIDLAAEWAGFETVGQCELADYPTKVLEKHWPNVPRWRDIRSVTAESFRERTGLQTVDLISGGFPCQPFSVAGKQRGKEDDRYLWPEMFRIIQELKPAWVLGENVANFANMELDQVLFDLESKGYTTIPFVIPACGVDAPHRRERVFILAHSGCTLRQGTIIKRTDEDEIGKGDANISERPSGSSSSNVADTDSQGLQTQRIRGRLQEEERQTRSSLKRRSLLGEERHTTGWESEPELGRVANGITNRVDRIKCLGNAVVPQQVYPILKAIAEVEKCVK